MTYKRIITNKTNIMNKEDVLKHDEAMNTSDAMVELLKGFEGFRAAAYKCPAGVWTIGHGHTGADVSAAGWKDAEGVVHSRITKEQGTALLRKDLKTAETYVGRAHEALKIARGGTYGFDQRQFDALVSFTYNVGCGSFVRSTLRKLAVQPRTKDASIVRQFTLWVKGGGKVLPGLVKRRAIEAAWWVYGSRWPEEIGNEAAAVKWAKGFKL